MPFEYHAPADHLERQILSSTSEESRTRDGDHHTTVVNAVTSRLVACIKDAYRSNKIKMPTRFGQGAIGVNTLTDNIRDSKLIVDSQGFAAWRARGSQGSSSQGDGGGGGGGQDGSQGGGGQEGSQGGGGGLDVGDSSNTEEEERPPNPNPKPKPKPNPTPYPNPNTNQVEEGGSPGASRRASWAHLARRRPSQRQGRARRARHQTATKTTTARTRTKKCW